MVVMSGNTGATGDVPGGDKALILMVANKLVYEVRRVGPDLARKHHIILS
jgi:hypothetical protein